MAYYYVFNGDADGLCALQQLRLDNWRDSSLVTGVKRDIRLLKRVSAGAGDTVCVLDVSLDSNRDDLCRLLDAGAIVHYFDHHYAGDIPQAPSLFSYIDLAADVCTSILVDRYLQGRHHLWAITAAFGDNLSQVAQTMSVEAGLCADDIKTLELLGTCLNYNAYGQALDDLHFNPAMLADEMAKFVNPFEFAAHANVFARLVAGYEQDMERAGALNPLCKCEKAVVFVLPAQAWARRVIGVLANDLVQKFPGHAFALLCPNIQGDYTVSVRVPSGALMGADEFCRKFEGGGGRRLAGGVNHLAQDHIDGFVGKFSQHYSCLS